MPRPDYPGPPSFRPSDIALDGSIVFRSRCLRGGERASRRTTTAREPRARPRQIVPLPQSSVVLARDGGLLGELGSADAHERADRRAPAVRGAGVRRRGGPALLPARWRRRRWHRRRAQGRISATTRAARARSRSSSSATCIPTSSIVRDSSPRASSASRTPRARWSGTTTRSRSSKAYLNQIGFGHGWYGIEEARAHYFGKRRRGSRSPRRQRSRGDAEGPAALRSAATPDRARERRNLVLSLMAQQGYVTAAAARRRRRRSRW